MLMELQPELTSVLHVKDADKWQCYKKKTDDNQWKKITKTVAARKK